MIPCLAPNREGAVLPLLPPDIGAEDRRRRIAGAADTERFVAIMFIDIRESTALVEKRMPYDVIFLLNHFFEAVGGAVAAVGGAPNQFLGDGMMAIFGMDCEPHEACRQALAAAGPIFHRLGEMNRTLADELPRPISIGIGIHAGTVILGELGYRDRFLLTAIGDAVHVAARLQELTKEYHCQAVVSDKHIRRELEGRRRLWALVRRWVDLLLRSCLGGERGPHLRATKGNCGQDGHERGPNFEFR